MRRLACASLVALAVTLGSAPPRAGDLEDCAVTGTCTPAAGGARVIVQARAVCPYPHRPSDTVFSGGAGYIIKDDVRSGLGCR